MKNKKFSFGSFYSKVGNLLILAIIFIIFIFLSPVFLNSTNLLNILRQVSMVGIVSVGFTLLLISGGFDLSVGSQIAFASVIIALMIKDGMPSVPAVIIGLCTTALFGFIIGIIVVKAKVHPLIVTLGMMTSIRGLAFIISGAMPIYEIPDWIKFMGQGLLFGFLPVQVVLMIIIIAVGAIILNNTYFGRYLYAIGSNTEAAELCGINTDLIRVLAYTITGFLTGIAAIVMMGRVSSAQPSIASGFELDVLTAVVLGGVSLNGGQGSMVRAMIGVLIIGILSNGMSLIGLGDYWQQLLKGIILIAVIIADSFQVRSKMKNIN